MIPNHYSARLSELDLAMAIHIPPGGNWKNIPTSIPSQRLAQIRESYAKGGGSRSTYYGRLRPDAPAYTINTYFGRPGNGCHLHSIMLVVSTGLSASVKLQGSRAFQMTLFFWDLAQQSTRKLVMLFHHFLDIRLPYIWDLQEFL